jgi:putative sterol carrier protein
MPEYTLPELMAAMPGAFVPAKATGVNAVVQYHVSGEEAGDWIITIHEGVCTVEQGSAPKANLTMRMDSKDLRAMMTGKVNGVQLFMQGKLKIEGDLNLATKFANYFSR